jgi:hypothetical protein
MQMKNLSGLALEDVVMELAVRALDEDRIRLVVADTGCTPAMPGPLTARRAEQVGVDADELLALVRQDIAQLAVARRQAQHGLSPIEEVDATAIEADALDLLVGAHDHEWFWARVALHY